MKKMFRFFVCAAILAAGITGCTSDGEGPGPKPPKDDGKVEEGIPTYATFNFSVSEGDDGTGTKALIDDVGETVTLSDVRLIIFSGYSATDTCEVNVGVPVSYVGGTPSGPNDKVVQSKTVRILSGNNKLILIIANTSGDVTLDGAVNESGIPLGMTIAQFVARMYDMEGSTGSVITTNPASKVTDIDALTKLVEKTTRGYVMSNAIDLHAIKTLHPAIDSTSSRNGTPGNVDDPDNATNTIHIAIQRSVAKARIMYATTAATTPVNGSSPSTVDGSGYMDAATLNYTFLAINRSLYLFQRFPSNNQPTDPLGITGDPLTQMPVSPYYNDVTGGTGGNAATVCPYYYYNFDAAADWKSLAAYNVTPGTVPFYYLTENTHNDPTKGSTSDFAIKGQFVPAAGKVIMATPTPSTPDTITFNQVSNVFSLPQEYLSTAIYPAVTGNNSPSFGKLYQLRGTVNTFVDIVATGGGTKTRVDIDKIFFQSREMAYKIAYVMNNKGFDGFNPSNYKQFPGVPGDSLRYNLQDPKATTARALIAEYDQSTCYYGVRLEYPEKAYGVKRNHSYSANITQFKGIGAPDLDDLNFPPGESLGGETFVTATISIDPWRVVNWNVVPEDN
jgi:hypothetical protein